MAMFMKLTQMNGVPVLIFPGAIEMIEAYEFTPKPLDVKAKPEVVEGSAPIPVTTQKMVEPMSPAVAPAPTPVMCSKITFPHGKELYVRDLLDNIRSSAG